VRSMREWGWTIPWSYKELVRVGDYIEKMDGSLSTIAGEVLKDDTWATAVRIWATRPKSAVGDTSIILIRYQEGIDDYQPVGTYLVKVHYDRNQPVEVPTRFATQGQTLYKGGSVIGDLDFDVQQGDRFALDGYQCTVEYVLPQQPQWIEARFVIDISGARGA
jgi:hypothetical protein